MEYTDWYIDIVMDDLETIFNLLAISLTKLIDPEDTYLRSLIGVTVNICSALMEHVKKHYRKEGTEVAAKHQGVPDERPG